MEMKKIKIALAVLMLLIFMYSCSNTVNKKDKIQFLTSKKWILKKVTEKQNNVNFVRYNKNNSAKREIHDLGNIKLAFFKNGSFEIVNWDNQKENGTWVMVDADNRIITSTIRKGKSKVDTLLIKELIVNKLMYIQKNNFTVSTLELIPE